EVREEWIDYNGHLRDAGYALGLREANEALLAHLGLSEDYRAGTGQAMYTVESHIRYLAEAKQGDVIEAASLLVSADAKRLRLHTVLRRHDGTPVATGEYLYLHIGEAAGGVTPLPPDRWAAGRGQGAPFRARLAGPARAPGPRRRSPAGTADTELNPTPLTRGVTAIEATSMMTLSDIRARYGLPSDAAVFAALTAGDTLPA